MNHLLQRVVDLLTKNPVFRNSDEKLMSEVWYEDMVVLSQETRTHYLTFLRLLGEGKLTPYESITRMRRKAQELHPELRGSNYHSRLDNQESVKDDLRNTKAKTAKAGLKVHQSFHDQSISPGTL